MFFNFKIFLHLKSVAVSNFVEKKIKREKCNTSFYTHKHPKRPCFTQSDNDID